MKLRKSKDKADEAKRINTGADDEISAAVSQSKVKEEKKKLFMKRVKIWGGSGGGLLLIFLVYILMQPYDGTMAFGICKVFLELNSQYPQSLRLSTVEETGTNVRIWYTQIDSFGEYRMEAMQCFFKPDDTLGFILDKVKIGGREVNPDVVTRFNQTIPIILQNPPDLGLPDPLPDSLEGLQFDFDKFRHPVL